MVEPISTPWQPHRSRQMQGMETEKKIAKKKGARLHPRSGAGKIKDDASTDEAVVEIKDANLTHTVKGESLDHLLRRAISQGKDAEYVIYFTAHNLTLTGKITRGMG